MDLRLMRERFSGQEQLHAVQGVISRLAANSHHDNLQQEFRYLIRFWWQLSMTYQEVTLSELEEFVSPQKLSVILKLLEAMSQAGYAAIDDWVEHQSAILDFDELSRPRVVPQPLIESNTKLN